MAESRVGGEREKQRKDRANGEAGERRQSFGKTDHHLISVL